ncbi:arrestin domain-containing protein 3-like [Homalodisca vitripennis]|uniref:arrestin domain-containing protein 3-like n=1 Tax=Homalodisca vitripennis TaxID=197043 RepID=UPI001EEAD061|nr:arrestin domain-containing protein 3-like [Homalodisca vitripennis]
MRLLPSVLLKNTFLQCTTSWVALTEPIKREVSTTFCCMWCRSGPLTMVLNLPYAGFVPGQNIPMILEVDNASNVDVDNVVVKLLQVITWKASVPESKTKTDTVDLVELSLANVNAKDSKTFTQTFTVPVVPVYSLHQCSIITCNYVFKVKAGTSVCYLDLTEEVPVFLGTVPVYKDGEAFPVYSSVPISTMPMTQPPFNSSMPTAQQPFYPPLPTAAQAFNAYMPTANQPNTIQQTTCEPFQRHPSSPPMPAPEPTSNPSMPLPQAPLNSSDPSAEFTSTYPASLLPEPIDIKARPRNQGGWAH